MVPLKEIEEEIYQDNFRARCLGPLGRKYYSISVLLLENVMESADEKEPEI